MSFKNLQLSSVFILFLACNTCSVSFSLFSCLSLLSSTNSKPLWSSISSPFSPVMSTSVPVFLVYCFDFLSTDCIHFPVIHIFPYPVLVTDQWEYLIDRLVEWSRLKSNRIRNEVIRLYVPEGLQFLWPNNSNRTRNRCYWKTYSD